MALNFNGLGGSKFNSNVRSIVMSLFKFLDTVPWGQHIWPGSGWRTGSSEHASGRAVDLMVSSKVGRLPTASQREAGEALVALLIKNGKALNIQWLVWSYDGAAKWSYNFDRGTWKRLGHKASNPSWNHQDHVHVFFKPSVKAIPSGYRWASGAAGGGVGTVKPPVPTYSTRLVSGVAERDILNPDAGTTNWALVYTIQKALAARYPGLNIVRFSGKWDRNTLGWYSAHQRSLGYKGKDADGRPGYNSLKVLADSTKLFKLTK